MTYCGLPLCDKKSFPKYSPIKPKNKNCVPVNINNITDKKVQPAGKLPTNSFSNKIMADKTIPPQNIKNPIIVKIRIGLTEKLMNIFK